jgi:hypothetical protein
MITIRITLEYSDKPSITFDKVVFEANAELVIEQYRDVNQTIKATYVVKRQ